MIGFSRGIIINASDPRHRVTLRRRPLTLQVRAARLLPDLLQTYGAAARAGADYRAEAAEGASAWLWLGPALLLQRPPRHARGRAA